ncbi:hypothetical protein T02_228 [Trichinella nativa]|uniref:Uncharacterized protein n=1 Tax=Trichinella nativa TaxID=6335 RepID=A0A0V1KVB7_9BILA|nr:hypothetical protein T02_5999 [Trichinella nativa]KRZ50488.1 hypothetical protein T02_11929 [Trichinella nativa]KRZ51279.1 hypothetical protein T02_228 [Trichinella nativa]
MQEYNDGIILFSAISIYVSPLTSVLRSNECQQALFTFHLQISIYTYCKSLIKGYNIQSEQGKDPNNTHTFRYKRVEYVQFLNLHLLVALNRSNINHSWLNDHRHLIVYILTEFQK